MNRLQVGMNGSGMERGQSLVETAVVAPLLVLLILGILDLGRIVFINTMLSSAAQDGARAGLVTSNFSAIESSVRNRLSGVDKDGVVIRIDRTEAYTEVEIVYRFTPITPLITTVIGGDEIELRRVTRMQRLGATISP
jgi:Flp pilus assembly protein TadG